MHSILIVRVIKILCYYFIRRKYHLHKNKLLKKQLVNMPQNGKNRKRDAGFNLVWAKFLVTVRKKCFYY